MKMRRASRGMEASVPRETGLKTIAGSDEAVRKPWCVVLHSGRERRGRLVGGQRVVAVVGRRWALKWPVWGFPSLPLPCSLVPASANRSRITLHYSDGDRLTLPAPITCLLS